MRKLFTKIHIWLSIPFGLIIAVVCLTGALLVFETEILDRCYPSRYFVKEVTGEVLPPVELMASARRLLPDSVQINGLRITADPKRTYQLLLPGKKAACFINPYTGEITGIDDGQGFFMQTMRLHRWLLNSNKRDGSFFVGKALVGYATLVLAVILISGLIAWFPRNKKMLKNRLTITFRSGWKRFFYDLHVSGGFYATLLLLVMTLTGLTWSFEWYRKAFYSVFGVKMEQAYTHASKLKNPAGKQHEGKDKRPEKTDYTQWADVLSNLQSRYPDFKSITIQNGTATVSASNYGNTRGSDQYFFDPVTGKITEVRLYKNLPNSRKIREWIYSVHVGSWGGMTTRLFFCLAAFLGAVFVITGYYFQFRKWTRKRTRITQTRNDEKQEKC